MATLAATVEMAAAPSKRKQKRKGNYRRKNTFIIILISFLLGKKTIELSASAKLALERRQSKNGVAIELPVNEHLNAFEYVYEIPDELIENEMFQDIYHKFESLHPASTVPETYIDAYKTTEDGEGGSRENEAVDLANDVDNDEISKKKARKLYRMTVAQLKSLVQRPEVVEVRALSPINVFCILFFVFELVV